MVDPGGALLEFRVEPVPGLGFGRQTACAGQEASPLQALLNRARRLLLNAVIVNEIADLLIHC